MFIQHTHIRTFVGAYDATTKCTHYMHTYLYLHFLQFELFGYLFPSLEVGVLVLKKLLFHVGQLAGGEMGPRSPGELIFILGIVRCCHLPACMDKQTQWHSKQQTQWQSKQQTQWQSKQQMQWHSKQQTSIYTLLQPTWPCNKHSDTTTRCVHLVRR